MKKFFTLFLTLMTSVMLWAYDFQSGDLYYNITSNVAPYTVEVTSGNTKYSGDITIPSSVTYNGITYAVTGIRSRAFEGCSSLTSVTIPSSVTSIGYAAFEDTGIFNDNSNWENGVLYISNCLVDAKESLSGACTIKYGTRIIADYAFYNCSSLTSVTIPNNVTSIGGWAFCKCSSLTSVTIPNSVTSIGQYAFSKCSDLTSVTIPSSVTSIGIQAFAGCSSLTSITIPSSVTSIGERAFEGCSSLTSVTIPNSVTSIGERAFEGCSSLTSVTIPNNVTSIGSGAFYNCSSLTSVTIPSSVTSIGRLAFSGCSSLTAIIVEGDNTVYDSRENCNAIIETATNTLIAGCQSTTIPNSVTSIGSSAFSDCSSLTSVTIPNSVTSIGDRAFSICSSLTSVTIPSSVTSIGQYAFSKCSSLTSVTIPNSVTSIGIFAFEGCSSLTSVTIPNSVTSIKNHAFKDCSSLTSVTIPNSVTSIGTNAFYNTGIFNDNSNWENGMLYISNCLVAAKESLLGTYTIKDGTRIIGDRAFYNCSSLTSVTIPNSVTSIGGWAFQGCSSLTSITIPNSVTSIGNDAFRDTGIFNDNSNWENGVLYISNCLVNAKESLSGAYTIKNGTRIIGDRAFCNCSSLTSVTLPNSVTSIGSNAFYNCSSLTSVTIPSSVTSIGSGAFYNCSSLTSVTIPNSVTSIGYGAFYNCSSLTSVTIPNSVTSIGYGAFYNCSFLNTIYVEATNPPALGNSTFAGTPSPVCHIPCGTKAAYEASAWASQVSEFVEEPCEEYTITYTSTDGNIVIPNKADAFGANIVSNTYENGVGTITFDGPITSIGSNAFSECSSLTSIIIPNSVTSIGSQAFMACPNIVSMVVENGNPIYDSRENCNAIIETATNTLVEGCQNTIIPKSVTKIGDYAFSRCTSLKSIFIHEDITSIDNTSFAITSSVTSIIVDENNNIYDSRNNCNAIIETSSNTLIRGCENTIIPNDIIKLAPYSLSGIIRESLTIPKNVNNIGGQALLRTNIGKIFLNSYTPIPLGYSMEVFPFTCHIPCGTKAAYEASDWAQYVSEFVEDCDNGSYSRNVRIGYNTICLPHGAIHFTGATFYEIAHILKNKKKIFFDEVKTLEAGKPYIFYPHSYEVTIYYDNTTSAVPLSHNGLHGTFDGITAASNFLKGKYLVAGHFIVLCGNGCSLAANRAYIDLDEIPDKQKPAIPGIKRVSMDYSEENATTALDNITDESIVAPMQEGIYDILGRKVDAPTVSGFYIINGKKVFVAL